MPEPISAAALATTLGPSALQAGGSFLQSYMQGKQEKEMFEKKMRFEKQQFKHKQDLDLRGDQRSDESHDLSMAQGRQQYNSQAKQEARNDEFYLNALKSVSGA